MNCLIPNWKRIRTKGRVRAAESHIAGRLGVSDGEAWKMGARRSIFHLSMASFTSQPTVQNVCIKCRGLHSEQTKQPPCKRTVVLKWNLTEMGMMTQWMSEFGSSKNRFFHRYQNPNSCLCLCPLAIAQSNRTNFHKFRFLCISPTCCFLCSTHCICTWLCNLIHSVAAQPIFPLPSCSLFFLNLYLVQFFCCCNTVSLRWSQ